MTSPGHGPSPGAGSGPTNGSGARAGTSPGAGTPAADPGTVTLIGIGQVTRRPRRVALVGNPNVGKSSLFNALTGLHQKVSNYPGTTVERITGSFSALGTTMDVVDLPGTYSLLPHSPDEEVVRDALLGAIPGEPAPDVVVLVLDATNLERNLHLASQVVELGIPCVVALNQIDLALEQHVRVDPALLAERLGVAVIPTCGRTGQGRDDLAAAIVSGGRAAKPLVLAFAPEVHAEAEALVPVLGPTGHLREPTAAGIARILTSEAYAGLVRTRFRCTGAGDVATALDAARGRLATAGIDVAAGCALARYAAITRLLAGVVSRDEEARGWRRRLDRVFMHPASGAVSLVAIFSLVFMSIFSWVGPVMDAIGAALDAGGAWAAEAAGGGLLGNFLQAGVFSGAGAFLVFVPQIAVFFLALEVLDDTGYLARAAFLLDRTMGRFGLPGRAFLPMLSGFACAIPGIMGTRTISNFRDRMVTMAVLPLMSCTARMPVYLLVIGVSFAASWWAGTVLVVSMYLLGIVVAIAAASVLRRTVLRGGRTPLLLELPPYRAPVMRNVLRNVGRRTWTFVAGAGPVIFVLSLGLWGLLTFPRDVDLSRDFGAEVAAIEARAETLPEAEREGVLGEAAELRSLEAAERREKSYLGRMGRAIEPALRPLGFDWKVGVGILGSFAAREVFVSTLGVIYAAGEEADENDAGLIGRLQASRWPDGRPVHTPLSGVSLCVFYILAMQCMSTLAVLKRETGGWKWPVGIFAGMTVLAYTASLIVYQAGLALGF